LDITERYGKNKFNVGKKNLFILYSRT